MPNVGATVICTIRPALHVWSSVHHHPQKPPGTVTIEPNMAGKKDVKAELREAFDKADVDKKGYLTIPQAKEVLERILEFQLEDRLTRKIINRTDKDATHTIDFEEFCVAAKDLVSAVMDIAREFQRVDTDMSGYLTADEVTELLNRYGGSLTPDDHAVTDFIMSLDKDGDGRINFHEFIYFMADNLCNRRR